MSTTDQFLSAHGVSLDNAFAFLITNLEHPAVIHDICRQFGVTNQMISDILTEKQVQGITTDVVKGFFSSNGINSSDLDTISTNQTGSTQTPTNQQVIDVRSTSHNGGFLTNIAFDASANSYQYVFDMSKQAALIYHGTTTYTNMSGTTINGFGADDSIVFKNCASYSLSTNSSGVVSINLTGISGYQVHLDSITIAGLNATNVTSIAGFNALSVGDISVA